VQRQNTKHVPDCFGVQIWIYGIDSLRTWKSPIRSKLHRVYSPNDHYRFLRILSNRHWLIDCSWVRGLAAPMHLGLTWRALCAPFQFMGAKFQMAPRLTFLISPGSKEPNISFGVLSKAALPRGVPHWASSERERDAPFSNRHSLEPDESNAHTHNLLLFNPFIIQLSSMSVFPSCCPGRSLTKVFYTSVLPCLILSSFVRRSIAHSDHNYVFPATFRVEKSVLNFT
jgi:hypothetical protein